MILVLKVSKNELYCYFCDFFLFFYVQVTKKSLRLMVTMQKNSEIVDFTTITYVLLQNIFKETFRGVWFVVILHYTVILH